MLSIPTGHFQAPMIMKSVHIRFYNFICCTIWITVIHGHECSIWINCSSNVTAIDNCKIDPGVMVKKPKALKRMNLHFRVSLFFHLSEPNGAIRQLIGICCPTEWIHAYGCSSQIGDHVNRHIQKQTHLQLVILCKHGILCISLSPASSIEICLLVANMDPGVCNNSHR